MLTIKKIILTLLLLVCLSFEFTVALADSTSAFTISPLTTQSTVTSVGESAIHYSLTSNASKNLSQITVDAKWKSTGSSLSVVNNSCSGATLAPGGSCNFDIDIPGSSQSGSFVIEPKICAFNGLICSHPSNIVNVSVLQHPLPIRIYQIIFPLDNSSEQLIGINTTNTGDILRASIANPNRDGPLAISPDGSTVYVTHKNADSTYSVLVFDVTSSSLAQSTTSYSLSYQGSNLSSPGQIAITPDGNTLYVSDKSYSGSGYPMYKIDLSTGVVTGLTDATTGSVATYLRNIAISPDGLTVYASTGSPGDDSRFRVFQFDNNSSTTSISTVSKVTDLNSIRALFISSDGQMLYVGGQSSMGDGPATIVQYNVANNFAVVNTFLPTPSNGGNIYGAALSPDNSTIYATALNDGVFYLYDINTSGMTSGAGIIYPYSIVGFNSNFNYVAYAPDSSIVAMTNYGTSGNLTALFPPGSPSSVTTVNPAPGAVNMYSYTSSLFVN